MQGGHMCVKQHKNWKEKGKKKSSLAGRAKMESQWIVELTSSGRVDAVKKGPFPLIIYFPIRHCPARGKNTFICGTLFCEPSNQEPVHSSIVSIVESVANRLAVALTVCVCVTMCVFARSYLCLCVWKNRKYIPFSTSCNQKDFIHPLFFFLILWICSWRLTNGWNTAVVIQCLRL